MRVIPIITSILPSVLRQVCLLHPLTRPDKSSGARKQGKTLVKASGQTAGNDNDASYGVRVNGKVDEAVIFNEMKDW